MSDADGPGTEWLDPEAAGAGRTELVLRRRHEAAYAFARGLAGGRRVVDVACGVGYGAEVLGGAPSAYLGVDRSLEALRAAAARFGRPGVAFACGDVAAGIPVATDGAGLVLAFQILEHVPVAETPAFLEELRRVCAPEGRVVLTTPNRRHRLFPFQRPWNPYHVREFSREGLAEVLRGVFSEVDVRGLRADPEVERVELARAGRRRWLGLARPLWALLPGGVRAWLRRRLSGSSAADGESRAGGRGSGPGPDGGERGGEATSSRRAGAVTVDAFRVEEDPEGEGLDLVAVCRP